MHRTPFTTRSQVRRGRRGRRGAMLIEMMVAGILLTTVVILVGPLLLHSSQVRRCAAQRQLATQFAANCLERLVAGESQQLAEANVRQGWDTQKWLPEMTLEIEIRDEGARRRATVTVNWIDTGRGTARPVMLVGWLAANQEDSQ